MTPPLRLYVVRDYRAEGWPSMDVCADQLVAQLQQADSPVDCVDVAPDFCRTFSGANSSAGFGYNADRIVNRHLRLPLIVRRTVGDGDFLHVVDHSYAHVVQAAQAPRAGVYCHDLDAFQSLIDPGRHRRPWWFRKLAARTLAGLRRAALVFHNSREVGRQILEHRLTNPERLIHTPLGVSEEFTPNAAAIGDAVNVGDSPFLLHIGTNTLRKRLDVLLEVFASVRRQVPALRLVQIGGPWPADLEAQLDRLSIQAAVTQVRNLTRLQLADLYRRCAATLVTSEAEGFGLPVIEALACGAVVVASDLPTVREAGGPAVVYCPVADIATWSDSVTRLIREPKTAPPREARLQQAAQFSWREHARIVGDAYVALRRRLSEAGQS